MSSPIIDPKTRMSGESTREESPNSVDTDVNRGQTSHWSSSDYRNNGFNGQTFRSFSQTNRFRPQLHLNASTSHLSHNYSIDSNINSYNFTIPANRIHFNRSYSGPSAHTIQEYRPREPKPWITYNKNCQTLSEDKIREKVVKFRPFKTISVNDRNGVYGNSFEISIMTYNILSQDLLQIHSNLYEHCQPLSISWPERGHRIIRELVESNVDIICLQEVHFQHFNDLIMPALCEHGYANVFKRKTGGKEDGCAILYKTNKFSLVKTIKLELMRKDLSSILDRDNVGLIVELKPKQSKLDSSLIVANTHLLYNPRRGDVKIAQIRLLFAEIDKMALISTDLSKDRSALHYHPIILCGDLNSEPNSLLYDFILKGCVDLKHSNIGDISGQSRGRGNGRQIEYYHLDLLGVTSDSRFENSAIKSRSDSNEKMFIKHNFKLKSVYNKNKTNGFDDSMVSTSNRFESGLVDYIFYDYKQLKLIGFQRLMNDYEIRSIQNIPNLYLGSDHLSLMAKFLMS